MWYVESMKINRKQQQSEKRKKRRKEIDKRMKNGSRMYAAIEQFFIRLFFLFRKNQKWTRHKSVILRFRTQTARKIDGLCVSEKEKKMKQNRIEMHTKRTRTARVTMRRCIGLYLLLFFGFCFVLFQSIRFFDRSTHTHTLAHVYVNRKNGLRPILLRKNRPETISCSHTKNCCLFALRALSRVRRIERTKKNTHAHTENMWTSIKLSTLLLSRALWVVWGKIGISLYQHVHHVSGFSYLSFVPSIILCACVIYRAFKAGFFTLHLPLSPFLWLSVLFCSQSIANGNNNKRRQMPTLSIIIKLLTVTNYWIFDFI